MDANERVGMDGSHSKLLDAVGLCVICIALNVLGGQAATALKLPIYLDSMGTVLAAMLGGYIPGIAVGYITNLVNSVTDPSLVYYGIVNVVIAIGAAYFMQRGWFRKLPLTLLVALLFALVCALLSTVLMYFLNDGSMEASAGAPLAEFLYSNGMLGAFASQLAADLLIEFIDKMLVVLFSALIFHMLPDGLLERIDFRPWQQKPLSASEMSSALGTKPRGISLRTKFVIIIGSVMTIVAMATTVISYSSFHRSLIDTEVTYAKGITTLMAEAIDADRIDVFLEEGENAPGYLTTEGKLAEIRDSFEDVQYTYVYKILDDGCHVVFDPDTADEPGSDPGTVIDFDESFEDYLPTLLAGGEIEPVISDETYGWLLTVYAPLKDKAGTTVCYVAADVSMAKVAQDEAVFLAQTIALFSAFFILVCGIVLWLARFNIILPINSISRAAQDFMLDSDSVSSKSAERIEKLDIRTGDELENLYDAVNQMTQDAVRYTAEAQEKNETIARMQSNLIMVMADLVEGRDKFTGDHVRNTATYTKIIMNQMRREGIYSESLTNEFISNVYQSAPLHDVGKIVVSDTILNKPGRFTDEEFEIMKRHTIAGKEILESAKGAVSESSYLDEAQNLAAYHHEKWNGTGYPYGLSGEDIPLSARIMAVADVFDALVSKRSYKEGFPIDKALSIIEEGIGTHFDPQVARAFLHAQDKARLVAEKSKEKKRLEEDQARLHLIELQDGKDSAPAPAGGEEGAGESAPQGDSGEQGAASRAQDADGDTEAKR